MTVFSQRRVSVVNKLCKLIFNLISLANMTDSCRTRPAYEGCTYMN